MSNAENDRASPLVYHLHATASLSPAVADLPKEVNGQPAAYFWADGIRAGRYVHPAGQFELHVDEQRLDGWAENFHRMKAAGIDVPVPVDHSGSARDNVGYVVDVKRDGDTLKLLHQLIGDDAIRMAARNKVSLGIDPQFIDGRGVVFGDCVIHSSLTPVPLVPGQHGLIPLAAPGQPAMVFHLTGDESHARYADLFHRRLDALVGGGNITPACRDRIVKLFQPRGRPGVMLLSRDPAVLDGLLDALNQNRAIPLGERTGVQVLSRTIPGESSVDPALHERMVWMANGRT